MEDHEILYIRTGWGKAPFVISPSLIDKEWSKVFQSWPNLHQDLATAGISLQALQLELKDFRAGDQYNSYVESYVRKTGEFSMRAKQDKAWLHEQFKVMALEFLKYANPERRGSEPPTRYIADANDAELAAAEFMRWLGFPDAEASPVGPDGGIDVSSKKAVGQVKDYGKPIGRPELQQHLGVAVGEGGKLPIFFARSGYTNQALEWATEREMPLYEFDLAGSWAPSNAAGELLWTAGADRFLKNRESEDVHSVPKVNDDPPDRTPLVQSEVTAASDTDTGSADLTEEPTVSLVAELRQLSELRDSGVLDDEEFRAAKKKLLD